MSEEEKYEFTNNLQIYAKYCDKRAEAMDLMSSYGENITLREVLLKLNFSIAKCEQILMSDRTSERPILKKRDLEVEEIKKAMKLCFGNKEAVSKMTGLSKATVYRRIQEERQNGRWNDNDYRC